MRIHAPIVAVVLGSLAAACQSSNSGSTAASTAPQGSSVPATSGAPAPNGTWTCLICGETIKGDGHVGYYGACELHFCSRVDAEQFASYPKDKKAKVATPQVLACKKITNTTCPLTGAPLTATAAPVVYESKVIGFATMADANQFKSLPQAKQKDVISRWRSQSQTASAS